MPRTAASFLLWSSIVAVFGVCVATARPASAAPTGREAAADELYWAFHACEEGMQPDTAPARRLQLLDDYRFRKARAARADAGVLRGGKVRDYPVREWLSRCDSGLPKLAHHGRKQAAQTEAQAALAVCKTATDRSSLEEAESDYRAFKEKKQSALRLDPKVSSKRDLESCDKRVSDWLQKRRQVEETALKRYREDALKTLADSQREQDDSLSGERPGDRKVATR
jgi:hypothetical protein